MSTMPSYRVPYVDLSGYAVDAIGDIDLTSTLAKIPTDPTTVGESAHIRFYNDSGSTLEVWTSTGSFEDTIPAGAWPTYTLEPTTSTVYFKVINILPNPPIQKLSITIYPPGMDIPDTPSLGNSPVGIGGTVNTSGVQTLSNESNAKTQLVIDIGDSALAQLITINNDGTATWKVDVASAAHTILQILSAGNFLKLGQAGDTVEALGKVIVDQLLSAAAGLNVTAGGLTVTGGIGTDTFNSSGNAVVGGSLETNTIRDNVTQVDQIDLATAGATVNNAITLKGGILGPGSTSLNIDSNGTSVIQFKVNGVNIFQAASNGPTLNANMALMLLTNSISRVVGQNAVTCGSGTTITHGLGASPVNVSVTPAISQPGSATVGVNNVGSTTFRATVGAGTACAFWAYS